jgi:surfeit locus 1 family protein
MLIGLGLLLVLGTWQYLRFEEKSEFEQLRDARLELPPTAVSGAELTRHENDYRVVELAGTFDPSHIFLFKFRVRDSVPGYWMGQMLRTNDGSSVLINRGWVPREGGEDIAREQVASGPTTLQGLVFTPEQVISDDTTRAELSNRDTVPEITYWNTYDISGIYDAMGVEIDRPSIVIASSVHSGSPYPVASYDYVVAPYLTSEKHLGYSVTWYTLAGALILMWVAYGFGYLGSYASRAGGKSATNAPDA